MNIVNLLNVTYLCSSRTIETILLIKKNIKKIVFVYNYDGICFRIFESILDAYKSNGGDGNVKSIAEFTRENDLDNFLEKNL